MHAQFGSLTIDGACVPASAGPMVLPCGATLTNVGNRDLVVAANDKRGEAAAIFVIPPGQSQVLHTPPSGMWVLNVVPAQTIQNLREDGTLVLLGILGLAIYGGVKVIEHATDTHRR